MAIYVVRHACAGRKEEWTGPDGDRPLDEAGTRQADALAAVLAPHELRRLLSSPARRCVDTLQPLARRTGLDVETTAVLGVDASTPAVIGLLTSAEADQVALCTHGEVMVALLDWLRALHVEVDAPDASDERLLGKGTAWVIDIAEGGRPTLRHLAPMPLLECPAHPAAR